MDGNENIFENMKDVIVNVFGQVLLDIQDFTKEALEEITFIEKE